MKLLNCTPHNVTILTAGGHYRLTLVPSGIVPRVQLVEEFEGMLPISEGVSVLMYHTYAEATIEDLPDAVEGTMYVVSRLVAETARGRRDLLIPHDAMRDDQDRIVGCRALATVATTVE